MASAPIGYLPTLASLRFLAAAAVIAHHAIGFGPGYGGVSLFFVLSGYVIARSYRDRAGTWPEAWAFWRGRIRRIMPLHIATLALALPLGVAPFETILSNALLLHGWSLDPDVYFSLNAVAWTLSAEAFFYLCFPFVRDADWRLALTAIGVVLALAIAATAGGMDYAMQHGLFYINPLARFPEFLAGIALANGRAIRTVGLRSAGVVWTATIALVWALPSNALFEGLVFVPASLVTIAALARNQQSWLAHPWLVAAGEASFLIYMITHLMQRYMQALLGGSLAANVLAVLASLGIAAAWHFRSNLVVRMEAMPRHSP